MEHQGRQANSALEGLYSQLEAVHRELLASGAAAAQLVTLKDVIDHGLQPPTKASRSTTAAASAPDSDDSTMQE